MGVIEALPGATNVIPKSARILIDARSEDRRLLEEFRGALDAESRGAAQAARVERSKLDCLSDNLPAACDPRLRELLGRCATSLGYSSRTMASGAGHDMAFISQVAPAAMVFIPCKGGRSHTPEEWADAGALAAGTRVILEAILRIDAPTASPAAGSTASPGPGKDA